MDCDTYFLSNTALQIWQRNDIDGQNRMFSCLSQIHKEGFFRRVIYRNKSGDDSMNRDLAESAFLNAWETFNNNGKAGKVQFSQAVYTGYFYIAFKRSYLKMIGGELKKHGAEKAFMVGEPTSYDTMLDNE